MATSRCSLATRHRRHTYAANTVFSADIVDGEVKAPDIASNAVGSGKVSNNQVKSVDVRDDSLTDGGLVAADLAAGRSRHRSWRRRLSQRMAPAATDRPSSRRARSAPTSSFPARSGPQPCRTTR